MSEPSRLSRRRFLLLAAAIGTTPGLLVAAERLVRTPRQSRGPFYPLDLPLDSDNDLSRVKGKAGVARGEITDVVGRILDERGRPVADARVEVWQCDANGRYHHPQDGGVEERDLNFQGYGQFLTGADGSYRFRTIKPVPYPGRAPHIHFTVSGPGIEPLTTQMYVAGAPENAGDFLLNAVRDPAARAALVVPFEPHPVAAEARWLAPFDLVLVADGRFGRG
ncbi:MAG: protocatechuate 3,4-dioxygenase [Gammaproteobacteria bacterium]|jgi:protocatechuate 3,4-dioxygenase beta subunit|nr:protocatechuate 3,4-dioxygenase [Gammaproteobacteria bacterium]